MQIFELGHPYWKSWYEVYRRMGACFSQKVEFNWLGSPRRIDHGLWPKFF